MSLTIEICVVNHEHCKCYSVLYSLSELSAGSKLGEVKPPTAATGAHEEHNDPQSEQQSQGTAVFKKNITMHSLG